MSWCGKTTVCRLINGLIPHYFEGEKSGEVLLNGKDVSAQPIYETAQVVGGVFQNPRSQFFYVDTTSELAERVIVFENGAIKNEIVGEEFRKLSEEDTENTIQLKDFKFTYPDKVHGIGIESLTLPQNKIIAIVGHNGAGKSTLQGHFLD